MEKSLTGNHRLLRNLNSDVILNLIQTKIPASGNYLYINNDKQDSEPGNIDTSRKKSSTHHKNKRTNLHIPALEYLNFWRYLLNLSIISIYLSKNAKNTALFYKLNYQIVFTKKRNVTAFT